jgi:hypothetical protein
VTSMYNPVTRQYAIVVSELEMAADPQVWAKVAALLRKQPNKQQQVKLLVGEICERNI